jgi:glycosyltransferase involved in cell wall biosynthesis
MLVLIVTPTHNIENFLNETILSIVSQVGDFDLHYHIQDSQSTDATLDIINSWEQTLRRDDHPWGQKTISFSWISEPDEGIYDAINRGFSRLMASLPDHSSEDVVMGWINGDDTFPQGALQTVVQFFKANPAYDWITGVCCLIREDSAYMDIRDSPWGYSRRYLRQGYYDGRNFDFVQQEGTFWRQHLWEEVGGLNPNLRLAGDWDLWRRFAEHSELVTIRGVLGLHRRRAGQLSGNLGTYQQEIDAYQHQLKPVPQDKAAASSKDYFLAARWNNDDSTWQIDKQNIGGAPEDDPFWLSAQPKLAAHTDLRLKLAGSIYALKTTLKEILHPIKYVPGVPGSPELPQDNPTPESEN